MPVVSSNQFNLKSDPFGSLSRGMKLGEQFKQQQLANKQQEFLEGGGLSSPTAIQDAGKIGIDFQNKVANQLEMIDRRTGNIDQRKFSEAANFAFKIQNMPVERQNVEIANRIETLESQGRDASHSRQLLELPFEDRKLELEGLQVAALPNEDRLKMLSGGSRPNIQFGKQEMFKDDAGQIFWATTARDPRGGQIKSEITPMVDGSNPQGQLVPVSGSGITSQEKIGEAQEIANVKFSEKRRDILTTELADRNRAASRSVININRALKLADKASQGLTGYLKTQLAKIFPDIDVGDEGALQAAFTQLAIDKLQSFKGPTTDFEYDKALSIGGDISDPKTANIARLNALKRAAWFTQREFKQFREFTDKGGNPDDFSFDFGEEIQTKRGPIPLQDIQDTALENNLTIEQTIKRLNE